MPKFYFVFRKEEYFVKTVEADTEEEAYNFVCLLSPEEFDSVGGKDFEMVHCEELSPGVIPWNEKQN